MVYPTLWAFWTREVFGWGTALIGLTLAAYGIGITFTQGVVMQFLIPRLESSKLLSFQQLALYWPSWFLASLPALW